MGSSGGTTHRRNGLFVNIVLLGSLALPGTFAGAQNISVSVIDEKGKGVKSTLIHIFSNGEKTREFAETDDDGRKRLAFTCGKNDQWKAVPISTNYYESKPESCGPAVALKTISKPAIKSLWANAELAEKNGKYWAATQYYSEIVAWTAHVEPETAKDAETALYASFGMALDIDEPVAKSNTGKIWLTPSSQQVLIKYQASKGLPATGMLDYRTLRESSGVDVFPAYGGTVHGLE